jgi:hypothetical protein
MKFWYLNRFTLFFILLFSSRHKKLIARGPFATMLALAAKKAGMVKQVCFDARGAYTAELNEYNVVDDIGLKQSISSIERNALLNCDFRLAVSEMLVTYWKTQFGYDGKAHVVIPCTLNRLFVRPLPSEEDSARVKHTVGFRSEDVVLVYSGSSAGWQSFHLVDEFLATLLEKNKELKVLLLAKEFPAEFLRSAEYKNRMVCKWVSPENVGDLLCACDYGLIIREPSVTNQVSSPVKFAEYLACGLSLLISQEIGDYTDFVKQHNCGWVVEGGKLPLSLPLPSRSHKLALNALALDQFSKASFKEAYKKLCA